MERHEFALERAKKDLKVADHMINVTYKLVDDPKLLVSVIERLMSSLTYAMASVLFYERMYKRIPPFHESFESIFEVFKARCTRRYNINIQYITLVQDVKSLLDDRKKSPVEFSRGGKFVICSDSFRCRVVSPDHIKSYISKAKLFVREAENMVRING